MRVPTFIGRSILAWLALLPLYAAASPFSGLYVVGDSLSDQGNLFAATSVLGPTYGLPAIPASDHYFQGRFSNGEIYAGVLAGRLGLGLSNSLSGGNNFAFGGTRTDYNTVEVRPGEGVYPRGAYPWTLNLQRDAFSARVAISGVDRHALFVVFSGSNDVSDILRRRLNPATVIPNAVAGIRSVIEAFKAAGAETVLVPNLPDLGVVPRITQLEASNPGISALATALTRQYNLALDNMLSAESGIRIIRFDTFSFLDDVVAHPGNYGLLNATGPCFSGFVDPAPTGTVCATPDAYAFWDVEHPTRALHAALADKMFLAVSVPEPAESTLLVLGLVAMVLARVRPSLRGSLRRIQCRTRWSLPS